MTNLFTKLEKEGQDSSKLNLFILMGVSGSGKTEIGKMLAKSLNIKKDFMFLDADDFHSPQAKERMEANLPLNDEMRKPWVEAIMNKLVNLSLDGKNVVLAFSGLKKKHRACFRSLTYQCHYFYLRAYMNKIRLRMLNREEHFFKAELLTSQFLAMEEIDKNEKDIFEINGNVSFDEVYNQVLTLALKELNKDVL